MSIGSHENLLDKSLGENSPFIPCLHLFTPISQRPEGNAPRPAPPIEGTLMEFAKNIYASFHSLSVYVCTKWSKYDINKLVRHKTYVATKIHDERGRKPVPAGRLALAGQY